MYSSLFRTLCLLAALLLPMAAAHAQARLVERVARTAGGPPVIPYARYELPNGLTVLVHEDHSDPLVYVDVTYHVGSAREEEGKSGFAHFFEHMMFQGSENVGDEQHFRIVQEAGGTLNGSTNRDRTNYYEMAPRGQLETLLWLEADRMGFLLGAVTPQKFEVQRATVKNERNQNYDNAPYGLQRQLLARTLYPAGHPYSWMTIGLEEDLDRATLDDLKRFFLRWYGPNNAVLTVGGDVEPAEVARLAERYFGPIPRGPAVEPARYAPVALAADRYISYTDKNIRLPMLTVTIPTTPRFHADEAPLDYLAALLGGGKSSILHRRFVAARKAAQASASNATTELAGEFTVMVLPFPGQSLAAVEAEVRDILAGLDTLTISDDDLLKVRTQQEASLVNRMVSVSGKVSSLADYATLAGTPNYIGRQFEAYTRVTREDIRRVYRQYLQGKPAVVVSVLPAGSDLAPARPDTPPPTDRLAARPDPIGAGLAYARPQDTFDRSRRPAPRPAPLVAPPAFWKGAFENGIPFLGSTSDEAPIVVARLTIPGGQLLDAADPAKAGLARLTAALLNEGTERRSAEALSEALQKLGASISVSAGTEEIVVTMQTLRRNLGAAAALVEEMLLHPGFRADDFERVKQMQLESIAQQQRDPAAIGANVFRALSYAPDDVRALPLLGAPETVGAITPDDVRAFYEARLALGAARLVIVGDVSAAEARAAFGFLGRVPARTPEAAPPPAAPRAPRTAIYFVDKPGAPQSQIRIGYPTQLPYDATGEYFRTSLMNYVLGGSFSSRINLMLREKRGFTYGARSGFSGDAHDGLFQASAGVRSNVTDSAVVDFMNEIRGYAEGGITPEELAFLKNSVGQQDALAYETPGQKAAFLDRMLRYDLGPEFAAEQKRIIENLTADEVGALARKHLPADAMRIVVVGDGERVRPKLAALGYDIIEVDASGQPVAANR